MNRASKFLLTFLLVLTFSGCSLIPKNVEFFQDKVKAVPTYSKADREVQKETAELAARKAQQTYEAALVEESSPSVLVPAEDTAALNRSLTSSLGPPVTPWQKEAKVLASKLDRVEAKLDKRLDKFTDKQEENVGKKIEGSGLFSVPWIVWVLIVFAFVAGLLFVGYIFLQVLKVSSPAGPVIGLGMNAAQVGVEHVVKGFTQVLKGNEGFKKEVKSLFNAGDKTADTILEIFKRHQLVNQDTDVQTTIRELTKK